jgi:Ser/Thr protein kinase RdoA (MazF antagonist)
VADLLAGSPGLGRTPLEPALTAGERERLHALRPRWSDAAAELEALGIPDSIQHGDLHPANVTRDPSGRLRFIDFGDASVAHPFTALFVPLGVAAQDDLDDAGLTRLRESYLEVFSDLAPMPALRRGLATALRIARLQRVTSWDRALRAAPGDPDWGHRLLHALRRLLAEERA